MEFHGIGGAIAELRQEGEAITPESVEARLWARLRAWEQEFYQYGLHDGVVWSKRASRKRWEYAVLDYEVTAARTQAAPWQDEILGKYYAGIFKKYRKEGLDYEIGDTGRNANGLWHNWLRGFLQVVRAYTDTQGVKE